MKKLLSAIIILLAASLVTPFEWTDVKRASSCGSPETELLAYPIINSEIATEEVTANLCDENNSTFPGIKTTISQCDIAGASGKKIIVSRLTLLDDENKLVAFVYPNKASDFTPSKWDALKKASEKAVVSNDFGGAIVNQKEADKTYCISPLNPGKYGIESIEEMQYTLTPLGPNYLIAVTEGQSATINFEVEDGKAKNLATKYRTKNIQYTYDCGLYSGRYTLPLTVFDYFGDIQTKILIKVKTLDPIEITPERGDASWTLAVKSGTQTALATGVTETGTVGSAKIFGDKVEIAGKINSNILWDSATRKYLGAVMELSFDCPTAVQVGIEAGKRAAGKINIFRVGEAYAATPDYQNLLASVREKGKQSGNQVIRVVTVAREAQQEQTAQQRLATCRSCIESCGGSLGSPGTLDKQKTCYQDICQTDCKNIPIGTAIPGA